MVELRYKERFEQVDLTGLTVADVRAQYKPEFGIADKAAAVLNGKKVRSADEINTALEDSDKLVFKTASLNRTAFFVGALLLAMAITGSVFAFGFTSSAVTLGTTAASSDFATVSANTSATPSWTPMGSLKASTGTGTIFDISTAVSGYTGGFAATISFANVDQLVKVYRSLILIIEVRDSANNLVDINADGNADSQDMTLLTLENGSVTLSIDQGTAKNYTVMLKGGYYHCNLFQSSWTTDMCTPQLFCELSQR